MSAPRCSDLDYIDFTIASPRNYSCTEAARVQPNSPNAPAHDSFTRLLQSLEPDPEVLWLEAEPLVEKAKGVLVIDDSTLDKPYAKHIDLVTKHWSKGSKGTSLYLPVDWVIQAVLWPNPRLQQPR